MSKILSITIPSYNVENTLETTLDSLICPEIIDDIEIIIVNDGSKDNTLEIATKYQTKYKESIIIIDKENGGHGSTINAGLKIATGKYFKVIDGDDWVDSNALVSFVYELKNLNVDIIFNPYTKVYTDSSKNETVNVKGVYRNTVLNINDVINQIGDYYQMHSLTFKTNIIKNKFMIDEHCFYVDQEYILFSLPFVSTIVFLDDNVYQYRLGNIDQSVSVKSLQKNRNMHKHVVLNLSEMYQRDNSSYPEGIKLFLLDRISKLIYTQLNIYLSMRTACSETVSFWNELRKRGNSIYAELNTKTAYLMKLNPTLGYKIISLKFKMES